MLLIIHFDKSNGSQVDIAGKMGNEQVHLSIIWSSRKLETVNSNLNKVKCDDFIFMI